VGPFGAEFSRRAASYKDQLATSDRHAAVAQQGGERERGHARDAGTVLREDVGDEQGNCARRGSDHIASMRSALTRVNPGATRSRPGNEMFGIWETRRQLGLAPPLSLGELGMAKLPRELSPGEL
jgi:hypothetical protein